MSTALDSAVGVLPVIMVAGAATWMTKSLFDMSDQPRKKRKSRRRRRSVDKRFANLGF